MDYITRQTQEQFCRGIFRSFLAIDKLKVALTLKKSLTMAQKRKNRKN